MTHLGDVITTTTTAAAEAVAEAEAEAEAVAAAGAVARNSPPGDALGLALGITAQRQMGT